MSKSQDTTINGPLQQLTQDGTDAIRTVFVQLFNLAMKMEREQYLAAGHDERTTQRRGRANGYPAKCLQTLVSEVTVAVPKIRKHPPGHAFYPTALTRGRRVTRAVAAIVAEMYFSRVFTRRVAKVLKKVGIPSWEKNAGQSDRGGTGRGTGALA